MLQNEKKRVINYSAFIHRMVAERFVKKKNKDQKFVIHLDFNKLNNNSANLRWATQEEITAHNTKNPKVIKAQKKRMNNPKFINAKLDEGKVKQIKRFLKAGKPVTEIAGKFLVSDVQIYRIKRGENWSRIKI